MNTKLKDEQWDKIGLFLKRHPNVYVGNQSQCRQFVEAVLWIMRSGASWRLLPKDEGNWNTVYKRMSRWGDRGVWQDMFEHFSNDPDMQSVMIDSTLIRAHPSAAGARHEKGGKTHRH